MSEHETPPDLGCPDAGLPGSRHTAESSPRHCCPPLTPHPPVPPLIPPGVSTAFSYADAGPGSSKDRTVVLLLRTISEDRQLIAPGSDVP